MISFSSLKVVRINVIKRLITSCGLFDGHSSYVGYSKQLLHSPIEKVVFSHNKRDLSSSLSEEFLHFCKMKYSFIPSQSVTNVQRLKLFTMLKYFGFAKSMEVPHLKDIFFTLVPNNSKFDSLSVNVYNMLFREQDVAVKQKYLDHYQQYIQQTGTTLSLPTILPVTNAHRSTTESVEYVTRYEAHLFDPLFVSEYFQRMEEEVETIQYQLNSIATHVEYNSKREGGEISAKEDQALFNSVLDFGRCDRLRWLNPVHQSLHTTTGDEMPSQVLTRFPPLLIAYLLHRSNSHGYVPSANYFANMFNPANKSNHLAVPTVDHLEVDPVAHAIFVDMGLTLAAREGCQLGLEFVSREGDNSVGSGPGTTWRVESQSCGDEAEEEQEEGERVVVDFKK